MVGGITEADAYGGVLMSAGGKVLLREPTGHFGSYVWTFAKGKPKAGEEPAQTALRSVREETGYRARIIAAMPQAFRGTAAATSAFFLMEPVGRQGDFSQETAATRWADPGEARDLISRTGTAVGRARDLAVLRAAEEVLAKLPYVDRPGTCKEDWVTRPLPKERTEIALDLTYDERAMARIRKGIYPASMDDRWFAWFEGSTLRLHRSWTGFCIFEVRFERDGDRWRAASALANRSKKQYGNTDDDEDRKLVRGLIDDLLVEGPAEPRKDGFVSALAAAMQPNYLGSPGVVSELTSKVISAAVGWANGEVGYDDLMAVSGEVCRAFCDDTAGYTRMPGWHNRQALGGALIERFGLNAALCEDEDLYFVISESFAALWLHVHRMLQAFTDDPHAEWSPHGLEQFNRLQQFVDAVFLGIDGLGFPGMRLADFTWTPVRPQDPA